MRTYIIKSLIYVTLLVLSSLSVASTQIIEPAPIREIIQGSWITTIDGEKQLVSFKKDVVEVTLIENGVATTMHGSYVVDNNTVHIAWNDDIFGLANYVAKITPISPGKFKVVDLDTGTLAYFIKK